MYRNNFGGGIKVLYHDRYCTKILENFTFICDVFEVLTFSLIGANIDVIICVIYKPPSSSSNLFSELLCERILSHLDTSKNIILMGDFNINLYNPLKLNTTSNFINLLLQYSFFPIITLPAKYNDDSIYTPYSLIDQIWSNSLIGDDQKSGIIRAPITDHYPIFYLFSIFQPENVSLSNFRLVNNTTLEHFMENISRIKFHDFIVSLT